MRPLSDRTANFTDSVIRRMTRVSNKYSAINLSQGFQDFEPPKEILERLKEVANEDFHQYSITWGAQNTREALAAKATRFMGIDVDPDAEVVITCGGTEAMMAAVMSICNPGDKVVIFSPFYENYGADSILSGAEPYFVSLKPPSFSFDADELEAAFKKGAKVLILCNPSNPSGKVFTLQEMETIAEIARRYDAYVITDEVYEHIVYEPNKMVYMASLPGMRERTIVTGSLSKTYSITGWRLGYTIAPAEITDRIRKVHDFLTVGAAAPLQEAIVTGLNFSENYYKELLEKYTHKRDLFCNGLEDIGLRFKKPEGAYYVMVDISDWKYDDDLKFCYDLAEKVGVGAVPGSSFFHEKNNSYIRFHFAKKDETLNEALNRLQKLEVIR